VFERVNPQNRKNKSNFAPITKTRTQKPFLKRT